MKKPSGRADGLSEKHAQRCQTLYQRIVSETDPNLARNIKADEPVPPGFRKVGEPLVQAALSKGKPRKAYKNGTQPRKPDPPPGLKDELRAKLKALGKELGKELGTTGTTEQLQGRLDRVRREQQRQQQPSSPIAKKKKKTA